MHGGVRRWPACGLALVAFSICAAGVRAQDFQRSPLPEDPAYTLPAPRGQLVSSGSLDADAPVDLQKRVADLEKALKKIQDKAEADKKKAASRPSVTPGGRIQMDAATFDQDAESQLQVGDVQDGAEFRRARLRLLGDAFDVMDYCIEFDFATGKAAFKDVYITVKELPYVQNIRAGHFKEPFGLEQAESSNVLTFMERSLGDEGGIVPGRNVGVMAFGNPESELATFAIGGFVSQMPDDPPIYQNDNGGCAVTMRATWLPWYDEATEGRGLLHTGVAYSFRDMPPDVARTWKVRPEAHLGPQLINLPLFIDHEQLLGAEAAFVYGPFSLQSEWFGDFVNGLGDAENHTFHGAYAYVSYLLTGEHRPYNRKKGCFDRIRPFTNFFRVRTCDGDVATGWGAWEIGYRWSYLDVLDDDLVAVVGAGHVIDHTVGVNWYLNPYSRVMFNYVLSHADRVSRINNQNVLVADGNMGIFETRFQIDF